MATRVAVLVAAALLAGCAATPGDGDVVTAAATVFPLAWVAEEVAPDAAVSYVGAGGQEPHDLELTPSDRALLETADVLLYLGDLGFQPQVEAAARSARGMVVDVAAVAGPDRLLALGEHDDHDDDDHDDDDHDDDGDGDGDGDDGDGDEDAAGATDPHLWFDPQIMADVAVEAGAAFAAADPANAATYEANAAEVAASFRRLSDEFDALFTDCRHDTAIVSHAAYAYLLAGRDLHQEGISGPGGHGDASPQRLAELTERIRTEGVEAIAAEPTEGRADAEVLAVEAGVELVEIDPLEVAGDELAERGFPALLRDQAQAFAAVLGCG